MSIEAMKLIKSLLQDGDKIDSHTISAVVAECDAVILTQQPDNASCKSVQKRLEAQQPATGEPVAYVDRDGFIIETGLLLTPGTKLYTRPAPSVPADVVRDAERWRYAIADGGNQSMNFIDIFGDWDGDGDFVEVFDAARLADKKGGAA